MGQSPSLPDFVVVARILAPWGVRGEIKVQALTDFPERLAPQNRVYLDSCPMLIESSRRHNEHLIIKLAGLDSVDAVAKLRGHYLEVPSSELRPLPAGEYYHSQLIGLKVLSTSGEFLGEITAILPTGSNDVYLVHGRRGEVLIPAIADVVRSVDLDRGEMVIEPIEGLLAH